MPVIRNPKHRNYVSKNVFKNKTYPPYCSGGGYVIHKKNLNCLINASKIVKIFKNEDAYIGTLAKYCNIIPKNDDRFLYGIFSKKSPFKQNFCISKDAFVIHGIRNKSQISYQQKILNYQNNLTLCN